MKLWLEECRGEKLEVEKVVGRKGEEEKEERHRF